MDLIAYLVSWLSYRVVAICLGCVPLTYISGFFWYCRTPTSTKDFLGFPFTGGNRHAIFQFLAWAFWAASFGATIPVYLSLFTSSLQAVPASHADAVSGASAAAGVVAELFMVKALLAHNGAYKGVRVKQISPTAAATVVALIGVILTTTAACLLMATEYMPDLTSRLVYCAMSMSCLLIALSSTHGLGGHLRFRSLEEEEDSPRGEKSSKVAGAWRFFQPFAGGSAFVMTQAMGWTLFGIVIVFLGTLAKAMLAGVVAAVRGWLVGASLLMVASQVLVAASLLTWQGQKGARALLRPSPTHPESSLLGRLGPVILMYLPMHIFMTVVTFAVSTLPLPVSVAALTIGLTSYYVLGTWGAPQHFGGREWPLIVSWCSHHMEACLTSWFSDLTVLRDRPDGQEFQQGQKYVFGFHPHGLYPTGAGFLPMTATFRRLTNHLRPVTLTATALFYPPMLRDVVLWAGFRVVSRPSFIHALKTRGSVILCPGGQAELVTTHRMHRRNPHDNEFVITARHKGFIRVALEQRASVVPVLALGESLQVVNAVNLPKLQAFTYKRLGFPFPYFLAGRWHLLPLPRKTPLVYVIGEPIPPPDLAEDGIVSSEMIDHVHTEFYRQLADMFERHKERHPVLKHARLVIE